MDNILIYTIIGAIVGGFIGFIVKMAKKEQETKKQMLESMTETDKENLKNNRIEQLDSTNFTWTQIGMIGNVTESNGTMKLKVLWFNTVIKNNTYNDFQYADIKMSKDEYTNMGLQQGNYVRFFIDPNKASAKILNKEI